MIFVTLVTILALILYMVLSILVGKARGTYHIEAPAVTGNPDFERRYRVQMNTLEQLIVFIPALWMFADMWRPHVIAACIGALWIVGRILYARAYFADAAKRGPGMMLTLLSTTILLLGSLAGVIRSLFTHNYY